MPIDNTQGMMTEASRIAWDQQMQSCSHNVRVETRCVLCGDIAGMFDQYADPEFAADLLAAVDRALDQGAWK